jgi:hypothetical protein
MFEFRCFGHLVVGINHSFGSTLDWTSAEASF